MPSSKKDFMHYRRPSSLFTTILLVRIAFTTQSVYGNGWSTYRHDITRSGVTQEKVQPPLGLRWTYVPLYPPQTAWPWPHEETPRMHFDNVYHTALYNGTVYFGTSHDNAIHALDMKSGEERWNFSAEGPIRLAPTVIQGKVFFSSDDGWIYCLNSSDGRLIWKRYAGPYDDKVIGSGHMISRWPIRTSLLVENDLVYFGAGVFPHEGLYVGALSGNDGSVVWVNDTFGDLGHDLQFGGFSPQGYLLASPNVLYVPSGRAMPGAFNRQTGAFLRFLDSGGQAGGCWALVCEGELIAGSDKSGSPAKIAFDDATGSKKGDIYAQYPGLDLIISPDVSYSLTADGIVAINRKEYHDITKKLTELGKEKKQIGDLIRAIRDELETATDAEKVRLNENLESQSARLATITQAEKQLNEQTLLWQYSKPHLHTLILSSDIIYAGGNGFVVAVDASTGKELWTHTVTGRAFGLAASEGHCIVSTDTGAIYCFAEGIQDSSQTIQTNATNPYHDDPSLNEIYQAAAESIIKSSNVKKGFALVLDCGEGQLAYELARRSELTIIGIERDPMRLEKAKQNLQAAGLYGIRVTFAPWDLEALPDYFANLIVSDACLAGGEIVYSAKDVLRMLRPFGGVAVLGNHPKTSKKDASDTRERLTEWVQSSGIPEIEVIPDTENWIVAVRGVLPGSSDWTHLYGNPSNTACATDELVKGPLGVLWYGEPGSSQMVDRHGRAMAPVAKDGRLYIQGEEVVSAYDAYNGTLLWKRSLPGAVRVRVDVDGGNLSVSENGLYVAAHDRCYRLDPTSGETMQVYSLPETTVGSVRRWGHISTVGNVLFGSAATPLLRDYADVWHSMVEDGKWKNFEVIIEQAPPEQRDRYRTYFQRLVEEHPVPNEAAWASFERSGLLWRPSANYPAWGSQSRADDAITEKMMAGDSLFAYDVQTGQLLWNFQGKRISNITPVYGDGNFYFTDSNPTEVQRKEGVDKRQFYIDKGIYIEGAEHETPYENRDVRTIYAVDAKTGETQWELNLDLTGCGGDRLCTVYHNGYLLFYGAFSNHDGSLFKQGSLGWRRITVLDAKTGEMIWSNPLNYLRRPLVIGDKIIIEPRACDLRTGEIIRRKHPVTGEEVPWEFFRPGHSCGIPSASPHLLFYRSYNVAYVDMDTDGGVSYFGGIRPGCWINMIPANGVVHFPEASSGCTCSFPLRCTVTFKQRRERQQDEKAWTVFVTHGPMTPVQHFAVNFGAPGDRKDDDGNLWFSYPRPNVSYAVPFDLNVKMTEDGNFYSNDYRGARIDSDRPWIFTSACAGLLQCELPLIDAEWNEAPGSYTVRIGMMALEGDKPGQRVFSIQLQDVTAIENLDAVSEAGGINKPLIKEFKGVQVTDKLHVKFIPQNPIASQFYAPVVNFIEVIREQPIPPKISKAQTKTEKLSKEASDSLLVQAESALQEGKTSDALQLYHQLFDSAPDQTYQVRALNGMAAIGSPDSLPRIEPYCRTQEAILWNYQPPAPEVITQSARVYLAIAQNVSSAETERAKRMADQVLKIANDAKVRTEAIMLLDKMGVEVGSKVADDGYITRWYLAGPFPWDERDNPTDKVFVNEPNIDLSQTFEINGRTVGWTKSIHEELMVDMERLMQPNKNVAVYAYAEVNVPEGGDILLKVGSDDGHLCWFNGALVGRFDSDRSWTADQDIFPVTAKPGKNTILLKVTQGGNEWAFSTRLTDRENRPMVVREYKEAHR